MNSHYAADSSARVALAVISLETTLCMTPCPSLSEFSARTRPRATVPKYRIRTKGLGCQA
jgi:hypothetical protein